MDTQQIGTALSEFSAEVLAHAPVSAGVGVKGQTPGFPQTTGEPPAPVNGNWIARYEIVVMPHGDVAPDDVADVRTSGATHLREMIELDPTLGERVSGAAIISTGFADVIGVVEVSAVIDAPA